MSETSKSIQEAQKGLDSIINKTEIIRKNLLEIQDIVNSFSVKA